ncbi:TetR/AcrR family transcriptional regulator [Rhodococcus sp. HNM0569]|uniref:TetR/AcrR family transcriptional regulator n=1 Tax=Rhodococcus sp. HNM0569 TaxID=2716340 RepID=UPI00146E68F7|nr:TetR/AcrR family transcriptional regulator [Rhodococcus sp. HNM0569]NLU82786.1 TetR/AcrR family transcriptional regulator [Rhodococcus sp. HNM0569]
MTRAQQKAATRAGLVAAARDLFAEHGYAPVRIEDIARRAGCSRAAFYLHFPDKMTVLRAVSADSMHPRAAELYADLDRVLTTESKAEFTAWIEAAVDWFDRHRTLLPAWDQAVALEPGFTPVARQAIADLSDAMPGYLANWGPEREAEARLRIELLVAQLERFFARWAEQGTIDTPRELAVHVLADIWYSALVPSRSQPPA